MARKKKLKLMEDLFMESLSEFGDIIHEVRNRECVFSPALTMWLFLNQRTGNGVSLSKALYEFNEGKDRSLFKERTETKKGKVVPLSMNTGGFSKARHRLPLKLVTEITKSISEKVRLNNSKNSTWRGRRVYLLDGTRVDLNCTEDIEQHYPRSRNQNGKVQSPKMLCMFMHDLITGVAVNPVYGPWQGSKATSEQALSKQIILEAEKESLIIGDRNLGVFSVAHGAHVADHLVLFRLTSSRAKKLFGKDFKQKKVCKEAIWTPTKQTLKNNPEIPVDAKIKGRVIKQTVKGSNSEPLELLFFTTSEAPANALVKLYQSREKIEHDIRSLKCTLEMDILRSKSADMVQKELLIGVAAYNLLRGVIAQVARAVNLKPREISFTRAADFIRSYGHKLEKVKSRKEANDLIEELKIIFTQIRIYKRTKKRIEPRKVVRKVGRFPLMRESREEERNFLLNSKKKYYRGQKRKGQ